MTTQIRSAIYPVGGGKPVVTSQQLGNCRWAPNSALLVCQNSFPFNLTVVNAATGAVKRLAGGRFDGAVSFSPDSRRVAVVTFNRTGRGERLEVITLATRKVRVVRTGSFFSPAWGPTRIAFAIVRRPGPHQASDIYTVKPNGTGLRRLTRFRREGDITGLFPVAWSRNGRRILAGNSSPLFEADLDAWAVDPVHRRWHLISHGLSPTALSRDGRFVLGQTGDAEKTGIDVSNVVRTTWTAHGPRTVLIRHAWEPSWTR
jgi:hypothetical protein